MPSQNATTKNKQTTNPQTIEERRQATEEAIARYNLWLMAFTGILAFATAGLGAMNFFQLRLARAEFISTHRPKLIARQFQINPVWPNQNITVQFSIINVGSTDAIPTHIACEAALWNGSYFELPGIDPFVKPTDDCPLIVSGQRISSQAASRFILSQAQHTNLAANKLTVCVVGEITYADRLGVSRRTGFRRDWDRSSDRFIPSKNTDDEYCD